ncbi:MIT family metal ion transporter CorA [Lactobacillus selangorensis]|uniref:MIT family metal ion transporter CorA n=1 Tax=Lactobacillus selangorensis TaxID=81857 RepID=A0A0R2G7C9_9LACO|nr:magnesium transporter CorA family protein [Lactobacillus selangorensis]KRN29001.1 MIT family metal ion transporter CorA [Lactobacillus selangorensis]KRN32589.1 MIT family metal ion transporter CorA [Lactobacillus selangorensis]
MLTTKKINAHLTWVSLQDATDDERKKVAQQEKIMTTMMDFAKDDYERPRIVYNRENRNCLLIFDILRDGKISDDEPTTPLAMILNANNIITFTRSDTTYIDQWLTQFIQRSPHPEKLQAFDLMLHVLYLAASRYFDALNEIRQRRKSIEDQLENRSPKKGIRELMNLENKIVHLLTALKADNVLVNDLKRFSRKHLQLSEIQQDNLNDVQVKTSQGAEMAQLASTVIDHVAAAYNNTLNNNLNSTMKFLTVYSLILAIPTLVFSFFSQALHVPFRGLSNGWLVSVSIALIAIGFIVWFLRKNHFIGH